MHITDIISAYIDTEARGEGKKTEGRSVIHIYSVLHGNVLWKIIEQVAGSRYTFTGIKDEIVPYEAI